MSLDPASPRICVVIPARNAEATIAATLAALEGQDIEEPFEVVVVDDGSGDRTAEVAERSPMTTRVIRQPESMGPGRARNDGARSSGAPVIAFTDSDCEPEPSWLREAQAAIERCDLLQGKVLPVDGPLGPFDRTVNVTFPSGFYETANLIVKREWFERVGGFEDLLRHRPKDKGIGEDVLFGWKLRRDGARIGWSDRAVVRHAVFVRGPGGFVAERLRLWYFPDLFRRVPELRRERSFAGLFLTRRTAAFDLALLALATTALTRSRVPLLATAPYLVIATGEARRRRGRRRLALVAGTDVAADAVGFASLLVGSLQRRSLVL